MGLIWYFRKGKPVFFPSWEQNFGGRGRNAAWPQPNRRGSPLWLPILRAATGSRPYISKQRLTKIKASSFSET